MKRGLVTLALILTMTIAGAAKDWGRQLGVIAYHLGTVAVGAIADAQYDMGNKEWGHALSATEVGMAMAGPFVFKIKLNEAPVYAASYLLLRFSTFDQMYNASRGLPILYNGTTSGYDKVMNKIPDHGKAWIKGVSFMVGVSIPIKEL